MQPHATVVRTNQSSEYLATLRSVAIVLHIEKFGIDDARALHEQAHLRPAEGIEQQFVVATNFITHEAQNALLKLFEEPPAGSIFELVLPVAMPLLPTLQSRIGAETTWRGTPAHSSTWQDFAAASPAERLKQIEAWHKTKDPEWLRDISIGMQSVEVTKLQPDARQALLLVGSRLGTRGASNKMLLEHLALALQL